MTRGGLLLLLVAMATGCAQPGPPRHTLSLVGSGAVLRPLREEEKALLEPIPIVYPEFTFPAWALMDDDTSRTLLPLARVPESMTGVETYSVYLLPRGPLVGYDYSLGPLKARGYFMVNTEHVGRSEIACDSAECTTLFWGDGQLWDSRSEPNQNYAALASLLDLPDESAVTPAEFTSVVPE